MALTSVSSRRGSRHRDVGRLIAQSLRDRILTGVLVPGDRLPSTTDIAAEWGTHGPVVQAALTPLVKEGLIERVPRRGSFVRQADKRLQRVGLYVPVSVLSGYEGLFSARLLAEIRAEIKARGQQEHIILDPRPYAEREEMLPEMEEACRCRRVQGVVAFGGQVAPRDWMRRLPVPITAMHQTYEMGAQFLVRMLMMGINHLAAMGCRRVAVVHPEHIGPENAHLICDEDLGAIARAAGLEWRKEWHVSPVQPFPKDRDSALAFEAYGYQAFKQLWSLDDRPDGMVVFTDYIARGALIAIGESQARIPEELRLVFHRNREIGLHCPYPAAFLDLHVRQLAGQLIDRLAAALDGRAYEPGEFFIHLVPAGQG